MGMDEWDRARTELEQIIGQVALDMTDLEESLDFLIIDALASPPSRAFFQRYVLGGMMIGAKVRLLTEYVKFFDDALADAEGALRHLDAIERANRERNRLIHDLHDIDFDTAKMTRRRLWQDSAIEIDLESYRALSNRTSILAGPVIEALADALAVTRG